VPEKSLRISRASKSARRRPVMLGVAGDSAAGKTTLTAGLVEALGAQRCLSFAADDYHRFDRAERRIRNITPSHPDCNHIDIFEQHLQLLATGQPVLKPVYDHTIGKLVRPERVEPRDIVIVHGLLPLHSRLARACFDVTVFVDPAEDLRRTWRLRRDTTTRGYSTDQLTAEMAAADKDSAKFVRPQRAHADIVVRFASITERDDPPDTPPSAELLLRPTIRHPDLISVLRPEITPTAHLRLVRDDDGIPVDSVHIHGYASAEASVAAEKLIWEELGDPRIAIPESLGVLRCGRRSTPLAITQMILFHHLTNGAH
jgi:phosphoribulokinase